MRHSPLLLSKAVVGLEADLQAFLSAGYTQETVLDVLLGPGLKLLSNYTNHIVQTPLDTVFEKAVWPDR